MSTFEIYSQSKMLPKDSTNDLSGIESVDMPIRAACQLSR